MIDQNDILTFCLAHMSYNETCDQEVACPGKDLDSEYTKEKRIAKENAYYPGYYSQKGHRHKRTEDIDRNGERDFACAVGCKKLNNKTDADILDWIYRQKRDLRKSVQGEIKRLIREEIARTNSESCRCTPTENREA